MSVCYWYYTKLKMAGWNIQLNGIKMFVKILFTPRLAKMF